MSQVNDAMGPALPAEDRVSLARLEQSPLQDLLGAFSGKWAVLNSLAAAMTFVAFGAGVYCAWNAFSAGEARETVLWSAGALFATLAVATLKAHLWMDMTKNATLREIQRLELEIARLTRASTW